MVLCDKCRFEMFERCNIAHPSLYCTWGKWGCGKNIKKEKPKELNTCGKFKVILEASDQEGNDA